MSATTAILPRAPEFDDEALAAARCFPRVLRYEMSPDGCELWRLRRGVEGEPEWVPQPGPSAAAPPESAVHRGYLVSAAEFRALHDALLDAHGLRLLTHPEEYERTTYYPLQHALLAGAAPRARWVALPVPEGCGERDPRRSALASQGGSSGRTSETLSEALVADLSRLTCEEIAMERPAWRFVVLKDYAKSEKSTADDVERFLRAPADRPAELAERAAELAMQRARKGRLYRGVVLKEGVPLQVYPADCRSATLPPPPAATGGGFVANEWRLWFARPGYDVPPQLLRAMPNSLQDATRVAAPPRELIGRCAELAEELGNPYLTVDVAETEDELPGPEAGQRWIVLEVGDGAASGPAPGQDMSDHWRQLWVVFGRGSDEPSAAAGPAAAAAAAAEVEARAAGGAGTGPNGLRASQAAAAVEKAAAVLERAVDELRLAAEDDPESEAAKEASLAVEEAAEAVDEARMSVLAASAKLSSGRLSGEAAAPRTSRSSSRRSSGAAIPFP